MILERLLVLCNSFPDKENKYIGSIFVKNQLKYLSKYFEEVNVLVLAPRFLSNFKKMPTKDYSFGNINVHFVKYTEIPVTYFISRNLWIKRESNAVLNFIDSQGIKFDIIHAHNTWRAGRIGIEIKKRYKVPLVITEHTSNVLYSAVKKKSKEFIYTWKNADAIIRVNKKDIELFKKFGINEKKLFYLPNGFDPALFYPIDKHQARMKLGLTLDKKIILNVASLVPTKGQEYLIEAINHVVETRKDVLAVIVGGGPLRKRLKTKIKKLELEDYVKLAGARPHPEIPLWMNAADVFVMSSINEGTPTVLFEALGVGLPFVGTAVGGVPEIITSEEYGLLCPSKNSKCLAEKILIALEKDWDREKIRRYAKQFTWEDIGKEVLQVYRNVIEEVA